jgi:hypothetical protein
MLFTKYQNEQIKDDMGGACVRDMKSAYKTFLRKPERKRLL